MKKDTLALLAALSGLLLVVMFFLWKFQASFPQTVPPSDRNIAPQSINQPELSECVHWDENEQGCITDKWAITVAAGTDILQLTKELGVTSLQPIGTLESTYLITIPGSDSDPQAALQKLRHPAITWYKQQVAVTVQER